MRTDTTPSNSDAASASGLVIVGSAKVSTPSAEAVAEPAAAGEVGTVCVKAVHSSAAVITAYVCRMRHTRYQYF